MTTHEIDRVLRQQPSAKLVAKRISTTRANQPYPDMTKHNTEQSNIDVWGKPIREATP